MRVFGPPPPQKRGNKPEVIGNCALKNFINSNLRHKLLDSSRGRGRDAWETRKMLRNFDRKNIREEISWKLRG
jgi:hypothetical protein